MKSTINKENPIPMRFHNLAWQPSMFGAWLACLVVWALTPVLPANAETPVLPIAAEDIGKKAATDYQGDALGIVATSEGARLRCGFQKLEARATSEGLWLESTEPGAAGGLRLVGMAVGREVLERGPDPSGSLSADECALQSGSGLPHSRTLSRWGQQLALSEVLTPTGIVSVEDKVVRFIRPGLTEEYSVSADGVRQDFVIAAPPAEAGALRLDLALSGARAEAAGYGARLNLAGSGRQLAYSRLRVVDATGKELKARLEVGSLGDEVTSPRLSENANDFVEEVSLLTSAPTLAIFVDDASATYPIRIDPTFSDADWVALNPGIPGANGEINAIAADDSGNIYFGGHFTFIGTSWITNLAKWDGSSWSPVGEPLSGGVSSMVISGSNLYVGGGFIRAGAVTVDHIARWDGSAWSALDRGLFSSSYAVEINALAVSGTNLYVGGAFERAGGVQASGIAKWDGTTWSALGSGLTRPLNQAPSVGSLLTIGSDLYAGGVFTTAGGITVSNIAKWDGSAWSALGSGINGLVVSALAADGTNLYAGGRFTAAGGTTARNIAKWDGSAWSALGSGISDGSVYELVTSGTDLYAGGSFTNAGGLTVNYVTKWDGNNWSAMGGGMGGGEQPWVASLAAIGTNLYAGGLFTTAGGVGATHIAKWSGGRWSPLCPGMDGWVRTLAISGTNLYAGGDFRSAGNVGANRIAKWDRSTWSALGSGMNGVVLALVASGTNLYAGGYFTTAGQVPAYYIAKWDGSVWSALEGWGVNQPVYALIMSGTDLYAGGAFTKVGYQGLSANYITKWNGTTWSALGSGMNGTVSALAASGTNLYAGGYFTAAGGVSATNIARWDGSAWSALGSGMNARVTALLARGTNLYAGGEFTTAGGIAANRIARWDGSAWSAVGTGTGSSITALAVDDTHLYVGGYFTTAEGTPASYIARWGGSVWSALGSGMDNPVSALALDGAGHLFVGGQFWMAGTNVSPYIALANIPAVPGIAILTQPQSQTVSVGSTVDFQVVADGVPPLYHQWFFNRTNALPAATNANLRLANVQFSQSGAYTVVITNSLATVTSSVAMLTVLDPFISSQPTNQSVYAGDAVSFTVVAGGTPPLQYQWRKNGGTMPGATSSSLVFTNAQVADAASFDVVVANLHSSLTSAVAVLTVVPLPPRVVTNCSAADLVAAMVRGGTVTFACDGTITLANTITNRYDTVLDASGRSVTISGRGQARVFHVATNTSLTLINLTVSNGVATSGGGVFNEGGALNATNCVFSGNLAFVGGSFMGQPTFVAHGGALMNLGGSVSLEHCTFVGNRSWGGGAPFPQYGSAGSGGAIESSGTLNVFRCTFLENTAEGGNGATSYPRDSVSDSGTPGGYGNGGAIYVTGPLVVDASTFISNRVVGGRGGNGVTGFMPPFSAGLPGGNGADGGWAKGGAIHGNVGGIVVNSTFAYNTAMGGKGGAGSNGGPSLRPGQAGANGGAGGSSGDAFGAVCGNVQLINCTIAFNSGYATNGGLGGAGSSGVGGAPNGAPGPNGTDGRACGGMDGGSCVNTVVASNSPGGNCLSVADRGHNLSSDATCTFTPAGMNNTDPLLGPVADNGGPTLTMALLQGSPAIDAGAGSASLFTDQRGFPRPAGAATDIGSYEFGSVMPTVSIARAGGLNLNIVGYGNTGQVCRLLASTNLLHWVSLATNHIGSNGNALFNDTCGTGACRYYRLVMP